MPKKWTQRYVRAGDTASPESLQTELSAAQSSISTLDRDQMPAAWADATYIDDYAMLRVYADDRFPDTSGSAGEQAAGRDDGVMSNAFQCATYQDYPAGWTEIGSTTLTGFKGGSLHIEWAGCASVNPMFSDTLNNHYPGTPKYVRFRILVAGVVVVERRGTNYHESFRVFGGGRFPQGDLTVSFQARFPDQSIDEALVDNSGSSYHMPQAHIYANRYFAIGRWR